MNVNFSPQMLTFFHCQDRVCRDCASRYITFIIKDKNILHLVCPLCGEPGNLDDEAVATEYFNNFDILVKNCSLWPVETDLKYSRFNFYSLVDE